MSEPLPVRATVTVVGLVHPVATVVLPLIPGARPTIVIAGAFPIPWKASVMVKCVLSVIAKPFAVTLAAVLVARKLREELPSPSQPCGPGSLKPDHCWLLVDVVVCCDGLLAAKVLFNP
jgi:hypothetical protein